MTGYVMISKDSLIHKSLQNFLVPEIFERYDYVETLFYDTSINDLTAAHEIFKAFKINPRIIDNIKNTSTPFILEKRKDILDYLMNNNGFGSFYIRFKDTCFLSLESAVAQDNIEYLKENMELVKLKNNTTYLLGISCKFGAIKCYKFLKLNGAYYPREAPEFAIDSGNAEIIMDLYNNDFDFSDYFQHAINRRKYAVADWILENYSEVSISFDKCIETRNIRAACFCLENKIPLTIKNYFRFHNLNPTKAVRDYLLDQLSDKFIDELIDCYIEDCEKWPYSRNYDKARWDKNLDRLKELAERGYNMNRIVDNKCPLLLAAIRKNDELYQFFIDHGADENLELVHHIHLTLNTLLSIAKIEHSDIDSIHMNGVIVFVVHLVGF